VINRFLNFKEPAYLDLFTISSSSGSIRRERFSIIRSSTRTVKTQSRQSLPLIPCKSSAIRLTLTPLSHPQHSGLDSQKSSKKHRNRDFSMQHGVSKRRSSPGELPPVLGQRFAILIIIRFLRSESATTRLPLMQL
jgi:hypothetical protein